MGRFSSISSLNHLARLYGVQTAYYDDRHQRHPAPPESLLAVLRSLGAPVSTLKDAPAAWRERCQALWRRQLEPVVVTWDGKPLSVKIRLPSAVASATLDCHLKLETGEEQSWGLAADAPVVESAEIEGSGYVVKQLRLPDSLPWGYHRLTVAAQGAKDETIVIAAPLKAYLPQTEPENRSWGVFLPLYALHKNNSWGGGSFSDLETLSAWMASLGGQVLATLPLLATFLNDIFEPSPYLPASRLFWNEFYLDINQIPELEKCAQARALLESSLFREQLTSLRNSSLVDYRRQMTLKRRILEELARCFFSEPSHRTHGLQSFTKLKPLAQDYARFRATGEKQHTSWRSWPQPLRDGIIREADYSEENRRYHWYVQWLAHEQMESVTGKAQEAGLKLYLDLPLGVHPDGYDVWREREAFVPDTQAGAPPDTVFTKGQNWGFSPLDPEKIREQGYRYVISYLRHHLRYARILRIDHVMGLHRLFCIPNGMEASRGVYLRYRAEELYAILALESQRSEAVIVGEDLGTVPAYIRPVMRKHGLHRMFVLHYELATATQKGLPPVTRDSVASLNTHDLAPFASFWQGLDIRERERLGLLDKQGARREWLSRQDMIRSLVTFLRRKGWLKETAGDIPSALKACLSFLAGSQARLVLINLEDLWLETRPQNVPSTRAEYPNWQRKAQYSLEEFCQMPQVIDTLRMINRLRKRGRLER